MCSFLNDRTTVQEAKRRMRTKSDQAVLLLLLAASLSLNVYQYHRGPTTAVRPPGVGSGFQTGEQVGGLEVAEGDSSAATAMSSAGQASTVVYVFSDGCAWCRQNSPAIASLYSQAGDRFRFVGVSVGHQAAPSTPPTTLPLPFAVRRLAQRDGPFAQKVPGTPYTLVLSPQGTVLRSWMGAYAGTAKTEIEGFFHVKLPEIERP